MKNNVSKYLYAILLACGTNSLIGSDNPQRQSIGEPTVITGESVGKAGVKIAGSGNVFTVSNKAGYPIRVALVKTATRIGKASKGDIGKALSIKHEKYKELYTDKDGYTQIKITPSDNNMTEIGLIAKDGYTAFDNFKYSSDYDRTLWVARFRGDLDEALNQGFVGKNNKKVAVYNIGGMKDFVTVKPGMKFSNDIVLPSGRKEDRLVSTVEFKPTGAAAGANKK